VKGQELTLGGGSCSGGSSRYTGSVIVTYSVNQVVYGQTVHLRLTINDMPSSSITSTGTLSFPGMDKTKHIFLCFETELYYLFPLFQHPYHKHIYKDIVFNYLQMILFLHVYVHVFLQYYT
jgi:hypothetical protein